MTKLQLMSVLCDAQMSERCMQQRVRDERFLVSTAVILLRPFW